MKIKPFATELFFSRYEFNSEYLLSVSDCETVSIGELLELAGSAQEDFLNTRLNYTDSQGIPELRQAIADRCGNGVTSGQVIYLGSPVEGIYLTMQTLLEPGDEVIAIRPAYDALLNLVEHVTGRVVPFDLTPGPGRWELDYDALEAMVSAKTKMLVVNFPHNPTGFLPTPDEFNRLIEICRSRDILLFCDEMYRGLEPDPDCKLPTAAGVYDKAISLAGLSKTFGLPGLRSGWLLVPDSSIRDRIINWKHYTSICPAACSEQLALVAMRCADSLAARNREIIRRNLEIADHFFEKHDSLFQWRRPNAGSVGLVGVKPALTSGRDVATYCHELADSESIVLLPGECLGANAIRASGFGAEELAGFVRFGFGRRGFEASLAAYDRVLTKGLS